MLVPPVPPPLPYSDSEPKGGRPGHGRGFGSGAGRAKGQKDRVTVALKEAIVLAATHVGDELADAAEADGKTHPDGLMGYLTMVARSDIKAFAGLLGKVLPMTIAGDKGGGIEVVFRTVYEEAPKSAP